MTEMQTKDAGNTADYLAWACPSWLDEMANARTEQGRRVFLLYFNIRDLVFDPSHPPARPRDLLNISNFLAHRLQDRDLVLVLLALHRNLRLQASGSDVAAIVRQGQT